MYYEKKVSSGTQIMDFGKTDWMIVNKDDTAWPQGLTWNCEDKYLRGVEWVHGLFLFPLVLGKM